MKTRKNIVFKVLLLATVLCCFGQLVDAYADIQQNSSLVCSDSNKTENCVGSHDDTLDDDQLEPTVPLAPIDVAFVEYIGFRKLILFDHFSYINWQPPKI